MWHLARQAAVICLVLTIPPYLRHIESRRNNADGPSMGVPVGIAPAWVEKQEKDQAIAAAVKAKRQGEALGLWR